MLRPLTVAGILTLAACGTDTFTGDAGSDATVDVGDDAPVMDASIEAGADAIVMKDAGPTDAIALTDGKCGDPCVACVQSNCGTQILVCDLDMTCTNQLDMFVACRCADGGSCGSVLSNSNAKSVAMCAHNNCPSCGL